MDCPFCKHKTVYASYCDASCTTCGATFCDGISGFTVMAVRKKLKLTRRELSEKLDYSKHTIKKYEFSVPSRKYVSSLKRLVTKIYEDIR
jgi:DNA-binding XRE family transcriptional regulator